MCEYCATHAPTRFTKPLRELTPKTSRGYEFIEFCEEHLNFKPYTWQKLLVIHALELDEYCENYRFSVLFSIVGRQNGKTKLITSLVLWWMLIDRYREKNAFGQTVTDFTVLGTAQNLKTAAKPYREVSDILDETKPAHIDSLVPFVERIRTSNGSEEILMKNGARYEIRDGVNARGASGARVIMDEVREQQHTKAYAALVPTVSSFSNGQLWGISSGGTDISATYNLLMNKINKIEKGELNDPELGYFLWEAPQECDPLDSDAIRMANPSIGESNLTVETIQARFHEMTRADYYSEYLCQTVKNTTTPYISPALFAKCEIGNASVRANKLSKCAIGIDVSADREVTSVAVAVMQDDGIPFVSLPTPPKTGMMWVESYVEDLCETLNVDGVLIQERGCPAMELIPALTKNPIIPVFPVGGGWFAVATARLKDAITRQEVRFLTDQKPMRNAIIHGQVMPYAENVGWSRKRSGMDISPVVSATLALFGLTFDTNALLSARDLEERQKQNAKSVYADRGVFWA